MAMFRSVVSSLGSSADYFTLFGVLTASVIAFKTALGVFRFISTYILAGLLGLSADLKKAGSWAVVTGCTDGIGKAYAEQIAKKGINLVLISRTQDKLDALAKEIGTKFKVATRTIAVDFSRTDIYERIRVSLIGLDIGTLVNNVGMSYSFPEYFADLENRDKLIMDMINTNMTSCTMMTSLVITGMLERRRGIIINIASTAALLPLPLMAVYSATKAFVDNFSRSLNEETASKGVIHQVVVAGFVATKLSKIKKANILAPSPSTFVRSALATVGIESRTFGYWSHVIMMTSLVLPGMLERRRGFIVNVASMSALSPLPLLAVYAATKAYMVNLSQSLNEETASQGVIHQVIVPGFVSTKLSKIKKANVFVPTPDTYVRSALATIGMESVTFGYWSHAVMKMVNNFLPSSIAHNVLLKARAANYRKAGKTA